MDLLERTEFFKELQDTLGRSEVRIRAPVVPTKTELWLLNNSINPASAVLEECSNVGILQVDHTSIGFRHELARRAVEDSLPAHVLRVCMRKC